MKTVVGLLKDEHEAEAAIRDLRSAGAREGNIGIVSHEGLDDLEGISLEPMDIDGYGRLSAGGPLGTFLHTSAAEREPDSLRAALVQLGLGDDEARRFVDGVRRGYTLETVAVDDDDVDEALAIMKRHSTDLESEVPGRRGENADPGAMVIPVAKEELEIGKRDVPAGGMKVETRVRERPVEESIDLREERVDVERRKVDRPIEAGDDAFRDRSVEVTAKAEQAVVSKRARVIEEIVVRKDVKHRTEPIRENVRETEVDVKPSGEAFDPSRYREHWQKAYGKDKDYDFDAYSPAYRFGHEMRDDSRFSGEQWSDVEPNARAAWEERNPGTWQRFKDAVRQAWDRTVH